MTSERRPRSLWSAAGSLAGRLLPKGERRKHERGTANVLQCNRGTVLDFSTAGMRLSSPGLYTGTIDVELRVGERCVTVRAEVMWSKRLGFRKYEIGFAFRDVTPRLHKALQELAHNMCIG